MTNDFVKALRTGETVRTSHGVVHHGHIHDVPREVFNLGGWSPVGTAGRVTEPAPAAPAAPTKAELQARLTELGVEFDARANKADLQAALDAALAAVESQEPNEGDSTADTNDNAEDGDAGDQ